MCRAGFEQRGIEPATGYCSNEATPPALHAGLLVGTHESVFGLMEVICLCLLLCVLMRIVERVHSYGLNCVTVALGAAGSYRVSGRAQVQLLALISVSVLSALCSPSGFSNWFPKIKLNLFVWNKLDFVKVLSFLYLQLHWLMNLEMKIDLMKLDSQEYKLLARLREK